MFQFESSVDVVILWAGENVHDQTTLGNVNRRRNNQELRFLLRSLQNLRDYRKVFLVMDESAPDWIDTAQISIVRHDDILPEKVARPCQNSTLLQCYVHNIVGLSENFLLFDDDFSLIKTTSVQDFFPEPTTMRVVFSDADMVVTPNDILDNSYSYFLANTAKLLPMSALPRKASWHHLKPQKVSLSKETLRLFENEINLLNHMQIRDNSASILFYELTYHALIEDLIDLDINIIHENHRNFPSMLMCNLLDSEEETKNSFNKLLSVFPTYLCVNDDMGDTSVIGSVDFFQELMVSFFPEKSIFEKVCEDTNLVSEAKSLAKKFTQLERDQAVEQRDQAVEQRDQAVEQRDQAVEQRDQAVEQLRKIEKAFFWKITWIARKFIELIKSAYKNLSF